MFTFCSCCRFCRERARLAYFSSLLSGVICKDCIACIQPHFFTVRFSRLDSVNQIENLVIWILAVYERDTRYIVVSNPHDLACAKNLVSPKFTLTSIMLEFGNKCPGSGSREAGMDSIHVFLRTLPQRTRRQRDEKQGMYP